MGCYGLGMTPPWLEKIEIYISLMPKIAHSDNIFTPDFGHEKFSLTFPAPLFKSGTLFVWAPPFKIFSQHFRVLEQTFFSPPLKKGRARIRTPYYQMIH